MSVQEALANRCQSVAELSRSAIEWVTDEANAETVGPALKSTVLTLRRSARRAEKLAKSARRKMSVSVFGPSQAGKSFLVSVLARPEAGRLGADFPGPGGKLDYISEINPEGEGESTGLVTRFTMSKDPAPDGFPIQLVLLSAADIARTIINSFYNDGDQSEEPPEPADLKTHIDTFRAKAGSELPGLGFEDMLEVADYVNNTFGKAAYTSALRTFWDDAAEIAPRLSLQDQGAFLEILWGGHKPLTEMYVKLVGGLAKIGHAEEVHVPLSALVPRETSIIDVKTLHNMMKDDDDTLDVRTPSGQTTPLGRSILCALAAELVFPMQEQPSPLFGETDLLDFPGARNRFERPLDQTLANPDDTLSQLLLRGKVSYLFDRYVENQEITSMLLCVPDSNMETLDLPGLIENWIALTHGASPKARDGSDCILFFVLTKFDKHLGESAASGGAETRFSRRMEASLEKFGKNRDPWIDKWNEHQPFQNCYWLRNPNFFVEGLIEYDDNQREVRIRPEKEDRVAELREGCLSAPLVQKHFADPEAAWNAALGLNDGGVSFLLGNLTKVCTADSKIAQLQGQIDKVVSDVLPELERNYVSDDVEQRIEEKRASAAAIIDALEFALDSHRFGAVLTSLCVNQDAIMNRISRVPSSVRLSSAVKSSQPVVPVAAENAPSAPAPRRRIRPGQSTAKPAPAPVAEEPATTASAPQQPRIRTMTPEAFQAEGAIETWIEDLGQFREDNERLHRFGFDAERANELTNELIHGMRRTGVIDQIVDQLRQIAFAHTVDKQAQPAAIVCAERINNFVTYLGTDRMPENKRPQVDLGDGQSQPVFTSQPADDTAETLPMTPRATAEDTWTDWIHALDALFVDNAKDGDSGEIDIEQNMRLGEIISGLRNG